MAHSGIIERQAVRAILLTPECEILLMQIRPPQGGDMFWLPPGGGLEPGETIEAGAKRELEEELGLSDFTLGPLVWRREHTFNWAGQRFCQRGQYHIVHVNRFEPFISDDIEAQYLERFRWWPLDEIAQSKDRFTPLSLAEIVQKYLVYGPPRRPLEIEVIID